MYFHVVLALVVVAFAVHVLRLRTRSPSTVGETLLLWVLVGYCGVPMLAFMLYGLLHPRELAALTGFPPDSPFQVFTTWALLGMSVAAILAPRYRGAYLVGPSVAWAIFFGGATFIHLRQYAAAGSLDHGLALLVFATHGLISILLLGGLAASGVWRKDDRPPPALTRAS